MSVVSPATHSVRRDASKAANIGKFYCSDEVAELLGVSTRTVRREIGRKELIAHKIGRAVRIAEPDLKAFIARHRCL
jgi:excisionase family DNA binding protein